MGERGRVAIPVPDNVRDIRKDITHSEPKPPLRARSKRPTMPRGLTDAQKSLWRRVCDELEPLGILASLDREVLESYVMMFRARGEAWAELRDGGFLVVGQKGGRVKSPAWQVFREAVNVMEVLGRQLALSPAARLRLVVPEELPDDSDLD